MGEMGMFTAEHTEANLRGQLTSLTTPWAPSVSVADQPVSCPHKASNGKNSWDKAGVSSCAS